MNIIAFIFALVKKFVPIDDLEFSKMKTEADNWYIDQINPDKSASPTARLLQKHGSRWYVKLALAIAYIPATISIGRSMNELNNPTTNLPNSLKDEAKLW